MYVSFTQDMHEVGEGDGFVAVCLELGNLTAPTERALWVNISTVDGSAIGKGKLSC